MRDAGELTVETMGETGRRLRKRFSVTPAQAQVQPSDPFGHSDPAERSIWYQSRFYRANLHCRGRELFLRDLTVYSDIVPQPFLEKPTDRHGIEQRMPAVLDGYHWSDDHVRASGHICLRDSQGTSEVVEVATFAQVREVGSTLSVEVLTTGGHALYFVFGDRGFSIRLDSLPTGKTLGLEFEWAADRTALVAVTPKRLAYRFNGFDYTVKVSRGRAAQTAAGLRIDGSARGIELQLNQPA
jgi:hypothetical protein